MTCVPPNNAPVFNSGIYLSKSFEPSPDFAKLLSDSREEYRWKATAEAKSQEIILKLETDVRQRTWDLNADNAMWIVYEVSCWGGSRKHTLQSIAAASDEERGTFELLIRQLLDPHSAQTAIAGLTKQRGLGLVMASKIYRFCCPDLGAALDRHSSYFFNSLPVRGENVSTGFCTRFKREWSTGSHQGSRLAAYSEPNLLRNIEEYCLVYLPMLKAMADQLNAKGDNLPRETSVSKRRWRPADIEMAAYGWWSRTVKDFR